MAPKLTKKHIMLPPFAALRVKLAAQVLSHSVAAGISTMTALGALPQNTQHTARILDTFDKLFNCLNSYTIKNNKPYQHALMETSNHHSFFQDTLLWLNEIEGNSRVKVLPCIEGWKTFVRAMLFSDLQGASNANIKFLLTSRLNQDCLENLFSVIRGKCGRRDNSDCSQFISALQQCMVDSLMVQTETKNCRDDIDSFLFGLKNVLPSSAPKASQSPAPNNQVFTLTEESTNVPSLLNVQEVNVLTYIAGYICHKVGPKLCPQCSLVLTGPSTYSHQLIEQKQYSPAATLLSPSTYVCTALERGYTSVCEELLLMDNVKATLVRQLMKCVTVDKIPACPLFTQKGDPLFLFTHLFVNVRLHHSLRKSIRSFCTTKTKRNRKY